MTGQYGGGWTSDNGGRTFTRWETPLHVRALAERDGVLFAAADDMMDDFALASSEDGGQTWRPLLHFLDIRGPKRCVATECAEAFMMLRQTLEAGTGPPIIDVSLPEEKGCGCSTTADRPGVGIFAALLLMRLRRRRH